MLVTIGGFLHHKKAKLEATEGLEEATKTLVLPRRVTFRTMTSMAISEGKGAPPVNR
jgi:hypothetical protein